MNKFVFSDRTQPYLLPPDLREWLPEDDLAHFVVAAVERVPLSHFRVSGRPVYIDTAAQDTCIDRR